MTDTTTSGLEKRMREIAARVAAASAGEWRAKAIRYGAWVVDTELMCINGLKAWFGVAVVHAVDDHERLMTEGGKHDSRHDAELIAKAKEDISFLLEAVALLQSAVRCKDAAIESLVADKIQAADALAAKDAAKKRAPVQGFSAGIPWYMHLRAYDEYCKRYKAQPALIEGWCRGGFSTGELDEFIPGWREELSEGKRLHDIIAAKDAELDAADHLATALHATGEQLQAELIAKDAIIEKARVALEEHGYTWCDDFLVCVDCGCNKHEPHIPTCPVGAAIEAIGK